MSDSSFDLKFYGAILALALTAKGVTSCATKDHVDNATVNSLIVKPSGNSSKYLVMTNKGVFENSDDMFQGKFSSSDLQNELKVGKTYAFETNGFRVPFFSWYKNVLSAQEISTPNTGLSPVPSR